MNTYIKIVTCTGSETNIDIGICIGSEMNK